MVKILKPSALYSEGALIRVNSFIVIFGGLWHGDDLLQRNVSIHIPCLISGRSCGPYPSLVHLYTVPSRAHPAPKFPEIFTKSRTFPAPQKYTILPFPHRHRRAFSPFQHQWAKCNKQPQWKGTTPVQGSLHVCYSNVSLLSVLLLLFPRFASSSSSHYYCCCCCSCLLMVFLGCGQPCCVTSSAPQKYTCDCQDLFLRLLGAS